MRFFNWSHLLNTATSSVKLQLLHKFWTSVERFQSLGNLEGRNELERSASATRSFTFIYLKCCLCFRRLLSIAIETENKTNCFHCCKEYFPSWNRRGHKTSNHFFLFCQFVILIFTSKFGFSCLFLFVRHASNVNFVEFCEFLSHSENFYAISRK